MKKTIRLTEGDLHRIVNNIINEIFDESAFWQGAHKGTLDNLNRKKDMGMFYTINPKGIKRDNEKRLEPLNTHNMEINRDFFEQLNSEELVIPFSVYLNKSFIYSFDFNLKQIENIDTKYMSILGNMKVTRTIGSPETFARAFGSMEKENIVLKYDFSSQILKFTHAQKGLEIKPALNVNGKNNQSWNLLIRYATEYISGLHKYSRP